MLAAMMRRRWSVTLAVASAFGGCAFDDSLAGGVRITCDGDDDCVGGTTCAVDGVCRDPDANVPPSVEIGAIVRTTGPVTIPVTVFDLESDAAIVDLELQKDSGAWQKIAVSGNPVATSPEGVQSTLSWTPQFPPDLFTDGLLLRATAHGQETGGTGPTKESPTFAYGNTPPRVLQIVVPEVVRGEQVPIVVKVVDDEGDGLTIFGATLHFPSTNGNDTREPPQIPADSFVVSASDDPAENRQGTTTDVLPGVEQLVGLIWNSTLNPSCGVVDQATLALTFVDGLNAPSAPVTSSPFLFDNGPCP
jgi:hypothetical protein